MDREQDRTLDLLAPETYEPSDKRSDSGWTPLAIGALAGSPARAGHFHQVRRVQQTYLMRFNSSIQLRTIVSDDCAEAGGALTITNRFPSGVMS